MKLITSERLAFLERSEIRNMSVECDRVGGVNLSQGVCNCGAPNPVVNGVSMAIEAGLNTYTSHEGIEELRESIAAKMEKYNQIEVNPESNIIVSCGATGAFYSACLALLDKGDEVVIFEPYYGYHVYTLLAVGVIPVYIKMKLPNWTIDIDEVERAITPKTKAILINTPANPCGKVFSHAELDRLADLCIRKNLFVLTDEIYEYFVYDGHKHISPGSLSKISDRTVTISGYSKTFSITGWRIGYSVCNEKWAKLIGYANDLVYVCAPSPLQAGVAKGIKELPATFYSDLCQQYDKKRKQICDVLTDIGLYPHIPQGSYYVLANSSALPGDTSKERAMHLLTKVGVASVPGSAFYHGIDGEDLLRFCFAKPDAELDEACERLLRIKK